MVRYAITILAIAAIMFAAGSAGAAPPQELTILSYNTHLFEDSSAECMCKCGKWWWDFFPWHWWGRDCDWGDSVFEDHTRRGEIKSRIEACGADIVALQEVWAPSWQQWFVDEVNPTYPYAEILASQSTCMVDIPDGCLIYYGTCNWGTGLPTLGSGLVLLSKFPFSDIGFERFPTFTQCSIGGCEAWSDKGVLTATVDVGGVPIRIGISHALTGPDDKKSKWDTNYIPTAITPFQLNGESYIFALSQDGQGHIVRMEDYGSCWDEKEQKYNYGAGWKHLWQGPWGSHYDVVRSFELDGHPYLFGLSNDANHAYIFRINDDPSTGWTSMCDYDWYSTDVVAVESLQLDKHPYLFALHDANTAYIHRINDDPCTGWTTIYGGSMSSDYAAVASFELDGHPYLFALDNTDNHADIFRINDDPCTGWTGIYEGPMSSEHPNVTSFELDDHPYLFGIHTNNNAYIYRINDDPCTGWTYVYGDPRGEYMKAWYRFEYNTNDTSGYGNDGTPHGDPTYSTDSRGEAYSINLDGVDDYVTVGPVGISGSSPRTIAGWVKATKPAAEMTGWRGIFGFTGGDVAYRHFDIQRSAESDHYCIHVHSWLGNIAPLDQEWHHLAATYDGNKIAWYSDGSRVGSQGMALNTNDDVHIGKRADIGASFFPGLVDDVRIYSRALSQGEIAQLARSSISVFEMNGHPYLFLQGNCCDQYMDSPLCDWRPGEAYLMRINDDPCTGWEDLYQLEDIRIIRDRTVVAEDGPPAIMMGDFNIHRGKYGIMDELFRKAGAVDAYIEVHGTGEGGQTIDHDENTLMQYFCSQNEDCDPDDPDMVDRIDYVYVKQSGGGLQLVPTEAHVFRDWNYYVPGAGDEDLSDHYPLAVKFQIFEGGCTARVKGDLNCDRLINFADLAILSSAWMSGPGDGAWDPACDISEPGDDFIDMKDVDIIAWAWLTMPVHNVTRNTWYGFIQAAIDDANDADQIEVAPGTYYEAINFKGKAIRVYSSGGPDVTTIDPNGIGGAYHVVQCVSGEDANTILEGFTITGGNANGSGPHDQRGGGMFNYNSSPTVINCTFRGNTAEFYGGGMYNDHSLPTVTNCIFNQNEAEQALGGGIANYNNSHSNLTNCTLSGNVAAASGGIRNWDSSPIVTNCILWDNEGDEISSGGEGVPVVSYSDVEGGTGQPWFGTGCIDADPQFVNAAGGDFRLLSYASPCVDAGDNNSVPGDTTDLDGDGNTTEPIPWDLAGNPRIADGDGDANAVVDMGAFELNGPVWNITQNRLYSIIQAAIDDANDGDEIEVAAGVYYEAIDFNGQAVTLRSSDPNDPNIVADTIIDGTGHCHVVQCVSHEDANTILDGFTITGGNATGGWPDWYGGGMYNQQSSPTVTNCIFTGNSATLGGGMYNNNNSSPTVTDCIFTGNWAAVNGGGMCNDQSSPTVTNCTFSENTATGAGGGMLNWYSSPTVTDCNFSDNSATYDGGGMYNDNSSSAMVTNCTFSGNSSGSYGGGMCNDQSSPTVTDCNFSSNLASTGIGGGMHNRDGSHPTVTDCNFTGNSASEAGGMFNDSSSPAVTNCTFSSNSASGIGGGMYNFNNSSPAVTNCTFSGNSAGTDGGGMDNRVGSDPNLFNCTFSGNSATGVGGGTDNYESSPMVTNCVLWGDTPDEIYDNASFTTVNYSDVQGASVYPGIGNINADPCFVDGAGGDLRLSTPNSPCVDAGDNNSLPADTADLDGDGNTVEPIPFDLAGNPRVLDGDANGTAVVDMGAYEYPAAVAAAGRLVDLEEYCVIAAYWLEPASLAPTRKAVVPVPAMRNVEFAYLQELRGNRLAGK